jgi:hypothetical protein
MLFFSEGPVSDPRYRSESATLILRTQKLGLQLELIRYYDK